MFKQYPLTKTLIVASTFALTLCKGAYSQQMPPPDMPLPECKLVEGVETGACLDKSDDVDASIPGRFGEGVTLAIETLPAVPVCQTHNGTDVTLPWSPSPCFASVSSPTVETCGVIDLLDGGKFKEMSCSAAFYETPDFNGPLFIVQDEDGNRCGGAGNFQTFFFGGPGSQPDKYWSAVAPSKQKCSITFNGPRPTSLFGPTWVKVRVETGIAETGDYRRPGRLEFSELYVPVDGDMREGVLDLELLARHQVENEGDDLIATYTALVTNLGTESADGIQVQISLPDQLHFLSVSDSRCRQQNPRFTGGKVICENLSIAGAGDELDNDVFFIDVETRIVNSVELIDRIEMTATVADDEDNSNNTVSTTTLIEFESATFNDTRLAMTALDGLFDYKTADELLNQQCNVYLDDIYNRLLELQVQNPSAFDAISFGKITSGEYFWAKQRNFITRAGHVGVVVYLKGTDYRQTGIVIHGTPTWSPADSDPQTQLGTMDVGEHTSLLNQAEDFFHQGTQGHGMYYRTPFANFPGTPSSQGGVGCGFEGLYANNQNEFIRISTNCLPKVQEENPQVCPIFPDALVVRLESPVEITATNKDGKKVQTENGIMIAQELDGGIHSYAQPHEDGSFGWILTLPKDDYDIQLVGTATGDYTFTTMYIDDNGMMQKNVVQGSTELAQVANVNVTIDESNPPTTPTPTPTPTNPSSPPQAPSSGGSSGGSLSIFVIATLLVSSYYRRCKRK